MRGETAVATSDKNLIWKFPQEFWEYHKDHYQNDLCPHGTQTHDLNIRSRRDQTYQG